MPPETAPGTLTSKQIATEMRQPCVSLPALALAAGRAPKGSPGYPLPAQAEGHLLHGHGLGCRGHWAGHKEPQSFSAQAGSQAHGGQQ